MASATKDLSTLGSTLELDCSGVEASRGNFQYKSGTGTVVLEATNDVRPTANWFGIPDADGVAIVAIAAAGITVFSINGYNRIRARNTVAGVALLGSLAFS